MREGECAPLPGCGCMCHQPGGMAVAHFAPCCDEVREQFVADLQANSQLLQDLEQAMTQPITEPEGTTQMGCFTWPSGT